MKLYREVLIESVEQAEALPKGTVAIHKVAGRMVVRVQFGGGLFWREGKYEVESSDLVGWWTALVPIEAEECHSEDYGAYHLMEAIDGSKPFTAYLVDQEEA